MLRRLALSALAVLGLTAFAGCVRGGNDIFARGSEHFEMHAYRMYRDMTALHYDFDRYFFNVDERNPDNYPD